MKGITIRLEAGPRPAGSRHYHLFRGGPHPPVQDWNQKRSYRAMSRRAMPASKRI